MGQIAAEIDAFREFLAVRDAFDSCVVLNSDGLLATLRRPTLPIARPIRSDLAHDCSLRCYSCRSDCQRAFAKTTPPPPQQSSQSERRVVWAKACATFLAIAFVDIVHQE